MVDMRWFGQRLLVAICCSLPLFTGAVAGDDRGRRDRSSADREESRERARDRRSDTSVAQDRARDRRRQLSPEERQRLRRDVLEAYRYGRDGR